KGPSGSWVSWTPRPFSREARGPPSAAAAREFLGRGTSPWLLAVPLASNPLGETRTTLPVAVRTGEALALLGRRTLRASLVVPRAPQLDVIAIPADAQLAARTRSHDNPSMDSPIGLRGLDRRPRIISVDR